MRQRRASRGDHSGVRMYGETYRVQVTDGRQITDDHDYHEQKKSFSMLGSSPTFGGTIVLAVLSVQLLTAAVSGLAFFEGGVESVNLAFQLVGSAVVTLKNLRRFGQRPFKFDKHHSHY